MKDTIAAIASGMTASGIGIIRISGPEAFHVLGRIFRFAKSEKRIEDQKANTIHYGHIFRENETIDEVLVMLMKAPHTYTAEDTVEIDCHGGPFVMQKILQTVVENGARLAEPGEFTRRAFMNGRIDLSEAEAVMDVISAGSEDALKSSLKQLGGSVRREIADLRDKIITETAFIEAAIDDPEHYDLDGYGPTLLENLGKVRRRIDKLLATFEEGRIIRNGIRTVILGKPNAGKSSLLNYLLGEERAIVTDIAGTTRDSLEEHIRIGGLELVLTDTAGIRETGDIIERMGVDRALNLAAEADLILVVLDSSRAFDEDDEKIFDFIREKKAVILLNKSDLVPVISSSDIRERTAAPCVIISAKEETGGEELGGLLRSLFLSGRIGMNEETMITNVRHKEALTEAKRSLELACGSIEAGMPEDFISIDLMDAYAMLGKITGEAVEDDLADTIFSKFCMGK